MKHRPRRLRATPAIRNLVAETSIIPSKLIMPHFVCEGNGIRTGIDSMPGIDRVSIDNLLNDIESDLKLGIGTVHLFGIPEIKDEMGTGAYAANGIVQKAVREVKKNFPHLHLITDVCLCEYTSHGHCGIVREGKILNDPTIDLLAKIALSHAEAGADMVAPSDMMDGRIAVIRKALDEQGFSEAALMAYSAKYASAFYGPFRDAAGSTPVR